jgi:hypothetical protein
VNIAQLSRHGTLRAIDGAKPRSSGFSLALRTANPELRLYLVISTQTAIGDLHLVVGAVKVAALGDTVFLRSRPLQSSKSEAPKIFDDLGLQLFKILNDYQLFWRFVVFETRSYLINES